jgi:hypothetical protein
MSPAFRFDLVELPSACEVLRAEVRELIAGDLAAGLWVANSPSAMAAESAVCSSAYLVTEELLG